MGLINSNLPTVGVWSTSADASTASASNTIILGSNDTLPADFVITKGFIYYISHKHVVGVLMVGIYGKVEEAR